jgi:Kef-type K+ transport system membrane component KefB
MLVTKVLAKTAGVYPVTRLFGSPRGEGLYTSMLMSTGLTFGTISALFGLTHNVVDQAQFSALVAAVIASAVVPTLIANAWLLPRHHLPTAEAVAPSESETAARPAPGRRA